MMLADLIARQAGALEAIVDHLARIESRLDRLAVALEDHINHVAPPFRRAPIAPFLYNPNIFVTRDIFRR